MSYSGNDPAGSFVRIMNALLLVRMLKGMKELNRSQKKAFGRLDLVKVARPGHYV